MSTNLNLNFYYPWKSPSDGGCFCSLQCHSLCDMLLQLLSLPAQQGDISLQLDMIFLCEGSQRLDLAILPSSAT